MKRFGEYRTDIGANRIDRHQRGLAFTVPQRHLRFTRDGVLNAQVFQPRAIHSKLGDGTDSLQRAPPSVVLDGLLLS